jgi:hypothetical protein
VILVDANLLGYAYVASVPQHRAALSWLDLKLNGTAVVALPQIFGAEMGKSVDRLKVNCRQSEDGSADPCVYFFSRRNPFSASPRSKIDNEHDLKGNRRGVMDISEPSPVSPRSKMQSVESFCQLNGARARYRFLPGGSK